MEHANDPLLANHAMLYHQPQAASAGRAHHNDRNHLVFGPIAAVDDPGASSHHRGSHVDDRLDSIAVHAARLRSHRVSATRWKSLCNATSDVQGRGSPSLVRRDRSTPIASIGSVVSKGRSPRCQSTNVVGNLPTKGQRSIVMNWDPLTLRTILSALFAVMSVSMLINAAFAVYIARQAASRGYSFWHWCVGGFLGNVIIFAILLAMLPDRSLVGRREVYREQLRKRLHSRRSLTANALLQVPESSRPVEDMDTFQGETERVSGDRSADDRPVRYRPARDQSVGDQATHIEPLDRSIGDDVTLP